MQQAAYIIVEGLLHRSVLSSNVRMRIPILFATIRNQRVFWGSYYEIYELAQPGNGLEAIS